MIIQKEIENKLVLAYSETPNVSFLSRNFGLTEFLVKSILQRNEVKILGPRHNQNSKIHNKNEEFFNQIDSEIKAYYLGLFYSDGCVSIIKNKKRKTSFIHQASIGLKESDSYILKPLSEEIFGKEHIQYYIHKNKSYERTARVLIYSKKICEDLIKLGCFPRKSLTLNFPTFSIVPEHLFHHFIRGYFDGDGCACLNMDRENPNLNLSLSSSESFLKDFSKFFLEKGMKFSIQLNKILSYGIVQVQSVKSVIDFYEYIYKNASSNLFLKRKKEKFEKFFIRAYFKTIRKDNNRLFYNGKGISYTEKGWKCRFVLNGRYKCLGYFKTKEEAINTYNKEGMSRKKELKKDFEILEKISSFGFFVPMKDKKKEFDKLPVITHNLPHWNSIN